MGRTAKSRILILGAGLAGLSAACHLKTESAVYEKECSPGGLCRSARLGNFTFDYGGHLLHFRYAYTKQLIEKLLGRGLIRHIRNSWVYSHNTFVEYPFQTNLRYLPDEIRKECLDKAKEAWKKQPPAPDNNAGNFRDWVLSAFGSGIARHFMLPYNEKFWTIAPEQMTCHWLGGYVPVPSLEDIIKGSVSEQDRPWGYNWQFWYPMEGGIERLPRAFAKNVRNLNLGKEAVKIHAQRKIVEFNDGSSCVYGRLISTIPLTEIGRIMDYVPGEVEDCLGRLEHTSILTVDMAVDRARLSDKHWVYFPEKDFVFFRAGFPDNFSAPSDNGHSGSIYAEISFSQKKALPKEEIIKEVFAGMVKAGLLSKKDNILSARTKEIKYAYPLYNKYREGSVEKIKKFLESKNIYSIGRWGGWKYMTMEDSILDGMRLAGILED